MSDAPAMRRDGAGVEINERPGRAELNGAGPKMSFGILVHRGCVQIKLFLRLLHCRKNIGDPLDWTLVRF
jgi:hypothetical protein